MRRLLISLSLVLLALAAPRAAFSQGDSSDAFLNAYMANQQGQQLENSGDPEKALSKYRYAASLLNQISRDDPSWQPLVVDYRKRKVMENITRLQATLGSQGSSDQSEPPPSDLPTSEPAPPPMDSDLPSKSDDILPTPNLNAPESSGETPSGASGDQFQAMRDELNAAEKKLKAVEGEKEDIQSQLADALKQLDRTKISETEMRGELKQAQDQYQNAIADHAQGSAGVPANATQQQLLTRISQLQDALKDAEADRDAADEQNADYARRNQKNRQAAATAAQQLAAAEAQNTALTAKFAGAEATAADLEAARKQIAALTQAKNDADARADDLDVQLSSTSKTAARLLAAQKEIAALKAADQATAQQNAQKGGAVAAQLADARKQIDQLTRDRDTARDQATALNGQLADAQKQIASVKADRDSIAAQRDQALADLAKARDAAKHVDQLMADNATLTQKLAADDKIIKDFKSGSPEKDKEIADLRKQVNDTKALLTSAQQERDDLQGTLNQLQQQYDTTSTELTELKANEKMSASEKQTLTDENSVLRGIVLRQLKAQAPREQAKRLVMSELSDLKVQSDTLLQRIKYLGEPVVQLTDKEKALFKDPDVDLSDSDDNSQMNIDIAAPRQTASRDSAAGAASSPASSGTPAADTAQAAPPHAPSNTPPAAPDGMPPSLAASPSPSGTPMDLAELSSPAPAFSPGPEQSPPPDSIGSDTGAAPAAGSSQPVPADLADEAHTAKDAFDRGQYRDAERLYLDMLVKSPNNLYTLSNLGVVYFRDQKFKLAEESLKKAIAVDSQDTFSHCTLGIVYYREQRYDDAINSLVRALAINKNYAVAHNYLGITASEKGWHEAAVKELETAINIDPKYADACFNLAVVFATQHPPDFARARNYYKRAVDLGAEPDAELEQLLDSAPALAAPPSASAGAIHSQ